MTTGCSTFRLAGFGALLAWCTTAPALGCSDEAYFHLLRPPAAASGGETGAGGAAAAAGGAPAATGGAAGAGGQAESALIHRYDFEGTGTLLVDRVGGRDGEIRGGAELTGDGGLALDGSNDYVSLPSGLLRSLESVTFAAWLEWGGTPARCWQRILDFGNNDAPVQGDAGNVTSSLFVTPSNCPQNTLSAALDFADGSQFVRGTEPLVTGALSFVALVLSDPEERFELYHDGELVSGDDVRPGRLLADVDDANNWLGRSQWSQDQIVFLQGRYEEFRIYARALTPNEIRTLAERGPAAVSFHATENYRSE